MKLLKRAVALFKAEPQASSARKPEPIAATLPVEQLSEGELQAVASGQSPKYSDVKQRCMAVELIPFSNTLLKLSSASDTDGAIRSLASKRCANYFDQNPDEANAIVDDLGVEELNHILQHCSAEPIALHLFGKLGDENTLFNFIRSCKSTALRKRIIELIVNIDQLKSLLKQVKGKDKASYRIIKDKLNALKEQEKLQAALDASVIVLIDDYEAHAKRAYSSEYELQTGNLQRRLDKTRGALTSDQIRSCETLLASYYDVIRSQSESKNTDAAEASESCNGQNEATTLLEVTPKSLEITANEKPIEVKKTIANNEIDPAIKDTTDLAIEGFFESVKSAEAVSDEDLMNVVSLAHTAFCEKLEKTKIRESFNEEAEKIHTELRHYVGQLKSAPDLLNCLLEVFDNNSKLAEQSNDTLEALKRVIQKIQPFAVASLIIQPVLIRLKAALKLQNEIRAQKNELTKSLIRRAQAAVNQGKLRRAQSFKAELDSIVESGFILAGTLSRELEKLDESFIKLADWDEYAVIPKLEALTSKMKALANTGLSPEPLAAKIKRLQLEWKEASKGSLAADDTHWLAFKEVSDIAYAPCKVFYDELGAERDRNFSVRLQICEQLQHYFNNYHWDTANWSDVESLTQHARNEWKTCGEVRHEKHKEIFIKFNNVLSEIQNKLNDEYDRRAAEKLTLIQQAEKSRNEDSPADAVNLAKKLQERWKTIGRCQARNDRELWQKMRKHCDAIFEKRDKDREDLKAQITESSQTLDITIDTLNSIVKSDNDSFLEQIKTLDQQSLNEECLSKLPVELQKRYQQKNSKILDDIQQRRKAIKSEVEVAEWLEIFELNRLTLTPMASEFNEADYLERCNALKSTAKVFTTNLKEKLNASENNNQDEDLRLLCVHVEILAGVDSPNSDSVLRMECQVKQLQESFGKKSVNGVNVVAFIKQWMKASTNNNSSYSSLEARFNASWQKLKD